MVNSPMTVGSNTKLLIENDDLEEKRLRRKSKLMTNNILSPGGVQASPGRSINVDKDKRKSVNLSHVGMTNIQIKEHYSNCIKLSSENKINAKNAFGLHLIDYMKDLLKQSQKDESGTNFQIASCTLDAGVKIYAYRVDSVHSEAYKVLGSLGRAVENQDDGNADDGEMEGDGSQPNKTKRQKKKCTGKTIETNLKNINCEQYDLDFEVDPFFHKTSAAFDEGGTAGLLSYQLHSKSDLNNLMMDSSIKVNDVTATISETTNNEFDIANLRDICRRVNFESKHICPQFQSFQFHGWDNDSQEIGGNVFLPDESFNDNVHKFDVNAPVLSDVSESFTGDQFGGGGFDDDDNDRTLGPIQFDGREALADVSRVGTIGSINMSTMSSHLALSLQPSEYSYFSKDILSTWAGPLHWKVKPLSKEKNTTGSTIASNRTATKKTNIRIDFTQLLDAKKYFVAGRGSTHLKEATLEKNATQMTVLPPDLHYEAESLFKLFIREFISLKRQADAKTIDNEEDDWYDYNNKNDREGFCPIVNDDDGGGDYDDDDDNCSPPDMSFGPSQQPSILDGNAFTGDNLIAPPNKVRIVDINYAKAAKRIDVKKLKGAMWKMLCEDNQEKENNQLPKPNIESEMEEVVGKDGKSNVTGTFTFKSLYDALPSNVSNNMAKNLSGPIAFVCLLYLANEKELKLTGKEDMSDIVIEEGLYL